MPDHEPHEVIAPASPVTPPPPKTRAEEQDALTLATLRGEIERGASLLWNTNPIATVIGVLNGKTAVWVAEENECEEPRDQVCASELTDAALFGSPMLGLEPGERRRYLEIKLAELLLEAVRRAMQQQADRLLDALPISFGTREEGTRGAVRNITRARQTLLSLSRRDARLRDLLPVLFPRDLVGTLQLLEETSCCEACLGRGKVRTGKKRTTDKGHVVFLTKRCGDCDGNGWVAR